MPERDSERKFHPFHPILKRMWSGAENVFKGVLAKHRDKNVGKSAADGNSESESAASSAEAASSPDSSRLKL